MKTISKIRLSYFFGFALIAGLLGLAEYLEVYRAMTPCPLCMLQRFILIMLGILFFIGTITRMKRLGQIILGLLVLLTSATGVLLAGRQVWLQHAPPNNLGECVANLRYIFETLPFKQALEHVWIGGMECSEQGWVFWHLTLAEWSLLGFVGFIILGLVQLKRGLRV